ncbi:hypothetical protein UNPF46_08495 [Bradyrhizobium sp. UNPF46]|uniref:hypothetical protein n=1 Tax=Bradyrhizobium sp. UNPF46 TaxID=1141168 RepID=UPI00115272CE|nr:hypothetical protein [Bradyrhizobium sp. UNPF46]TQF41150.1 hypothetical protein UNPF46_08495 [Bradyrhizobium sp. UNPF46]
MTVPRKSQQQRILEVLQSLRTQHDIPEDYIRRHETGDGISSRYFKQVMLISEVNGRISELRGKGYVIETSEAEDRYGFKYHRLVRMPPPKQLSLAMTA